MTDTQITPDEDWTPTPAPRDGHWISLGYVGVDSGTIAICDPCMAEPDYDSMTFMNARDNTNYSAPYGQEGLGVQFLSGWGDGFYEVWGWVVDSGPAEGRIAQVVITMIAGK